MELFQALAWKKPHPEPAPDLVLPRDKEKKSDPDYFLIRPNNDLDEQEPNSQVTTADYDNPAWGDKDDDLIRIKVNASEFWAGVSDEIEDEDQWLTTEFIMPVP